jgi:RES domain-containing protein
MDAVLRGVKYSFNDEANAGCPYDKEITIEHLSSEDVLHQVIGSEEFDWPENLVMDVANALRNDGWVDAPDGEWMGSYQHERLHWSWDSFADAVKYRSRFHFQAGKRSREWGDNLLAVHEMLPFIGRMVLKHRMVRKLSPIMVLHRVRTGMHPSTVAALGPPSNEKVTVPAGRMNPAGIAYFYLAFDEKTALTETRAKAGDQVTTSAWSPSRELNVIDFSRLPKCPSVFSEKRREHDMVQFLYSFVNEISKPVTHDGREHIEYVPTQVLSEFFAQVFQDGNKNRVDGLIYPSAVAVGGKNLVVFPCVDTNGSQFDLMSLKGTNSGLVTSTMDALE